MEQRRMRLTLGMAGLAALAALGGPGDKTAGQQMAATAYRAQPAAAPARHLIIWRPTLRQHRHAPGQFCDDHIVAVAGAQFRLNGGVYYELNEMDNRAVNQLASGDEAGFRETLTHMIGLVRSHGSPEDPERLLDSDATLPPADLPLEEARQLFRGEGLLPF